MVPFRGARGLALACVLLSFFTCFVPTRQVAAQSRQAPTAEQLEILRSLPPEQQRALLEAVAGTDVGSQRADAPLTTPQITAPVQPLEPPADEGPSRIAGGSTLLLDVSIPETGDPSTIDPAQAAILSSRQARIHAGNPYRLDSEGRLDLPFLTEGIRLAGLTAEEAAQRLNADPRLAGLTFRVTLLPLEPVGAEALRPFGYDVFREAPTTFALATDIPVPPDYTLGPGDTVVLALFGKRTGSYSLVVDREGRLNVPDVGPLHVAGMSFSQVRSEIERLFSEQMIGVRASVSMGPLRSIRVFVLGDVARPGSYIVSGLSTVTHALFLSGGVSDVGSLRRIELKRGGATVGRLDLYDLLLRGDTSNDRQLQSGDVIFVPPVGVTAGIGGRVRRPAIYEVGPDATVGDLLQLAGGLAPDADGRMAKLERIDTSGVRVVLDVDLTSAAGLALRLSPGDVISVPGVLVDFQRTVSLEGHVLRPGRYAWRQGMRLTDLLGSLAALKINADQRYILIRREHLPSRRIEVISADAVEAFAARGSEADIPLQDRDRVIVFALQSDRGSVLGEVLEELRLQARDNGAAPIVSVTGRVKAPGQYPLEAGMTVRDLVRAGGGLDEAAYALTAELTRFEVVDGESRRTEVIDLALADILAGTPGVDVPLRPYDTLVIRETPEWSEQGSVTLHGEVRFPGTYPIRRGEKLSSVIERAGGVTDHAFPQGAVFTRVEIQNQERRQIESLAARIQNDLALLALQSSQGGAASKQDASEALSIGQSLLAQLRATKPVGRLVIDVKKALADPRSDENIELRDGDSLHIPPLRQYVTVIGEAQNPTSHVWRRGLTRDDYLNLSGGLTENADKKRIYVVRADGSVAVHQGGGRWFRRSGDTEIQPGDTIVVPLDTDRIRPLPLWTAATTIIYNIAVAVAAIGSL